MRDRVKRLRENMLHAKPNIDAERIVLAREAYQKYAGDAPAIFRGEVFAYILDHMELSIFDEEIIIGSQASEQRGVSIYPEYMAAEWIADNLDELQTRSTDPFVITDKNRKILENELPWWFGKSTEDRLNDVLDDEIQQARRLGAITIGNRVMPSCNTLANHERLLAEGLNGYISRCKKHISETIAKDKDYTSNDQDKVNFWQGCIIVCEAIIRYSERFSLLADNMATKETNYERKSELLTIAENCRVVPANPPKTFWQAVQYVWFIQLLLHTEANSAGNGFGRYDQYMYPYYVRDIEAGIISQEDALEMIEAFYIKTSELLIVRTSADARKFAGYPLWQILMVGGTDKYGNDSTNELTYLCLEGQNEVRLTQPAIGLRIHDGTPKELFDKAAAMIQSGIGNPAFFNDKISIPIVRAKGGSVEEANNWSVLGCVEPHPGGGATDGSTIGGYLNSMKALELVLNNGVDPVSGEFCGVKTGDPTKFKCKEDFIQAINAQIRHMWDLIIRGYNHVVAYHGAHMPVIFASLVVDDCIDNGLSAQNGGARHNYTGIFFCCPASVADSIEAIDYAVFKEKVITTDELIKVLNNNFAGKESLRQLLLNRANKFGNDNEEVDSICRDIIVASSNYAQQFKDARGGQYCVCNLSQTLNLLFGEYCGASPDGRLSGEPLSDNASPAGGRDLNGPTSTVKSVASTDQINTWDGTLFNLRFDAKGLEGERGINIIEGVVKTYFDNLGEHIQINVVDDATLRAAQRDPESYRGLVVRVAGYLAFFTDLDPKVQENIIERTAHVC